jgi:acyl carrier protein
MTDEQALALIRTAIDKVSAGAGERIGPETDLVVEEILDSLDIMNFLFHLEKAIGHRIESIDQDFSDFRIATLIDLVKQ